MKKTSRLLTFAAIIFSCIGSPSCNDEKDKNGTNAAQDSSEKAKIKVVKPATVAKYSRPPIVNIVDTSVTKKIVAYAKDSAANFERISLKLGKIYGVKLAEYIKKNNLRTTGAPMAWYKKEKAPYFFEAGIPINKKGAKPLTGVEVRELGAGNIVMAHFYGPFELLPQGYDAIKEWMKDNHKIAAGPPYEVYVTDPVDKKGKPVDPYKVQTDIVFPVE
jgi:effector-binding domain-containing protein